MSAPEEDKVARKVEPFKFQPEFCDNVVVTATYTWVNFLPKFLYYTFTQLNNFYFLCVGGLQMIPSISNSGGAPVSWMPLALVVMVDAALQISDDVKRHRADNVENSRRVARFEKASRTFQTVKWSDVLVGDVLQINANEMAPADMLLVNTVNANGAGGGTCFIETKNLDGETNLKQRTVPRELQEAAGGGGGDRGAPSSSAAPPLEERLAGLSLTVDCEAPNADTNSFRAQVLGVGSGEPVRVSIENTMFRSTMLRNTAAVHGLVLNTGQDTKIVNSSRHRAPAKRTTVTVMLNRVIIPTILFLIGLCLVGGVAGPLWDRGHHDHAYLGWEEHGIGLASEIVERVFYFFNLLSSFVPISLYVSINMVKKAQAWFMEQDLEM